MPATIINLPSSRITRLSNPSTAAGFTHKITVLYADLNKTSATAGFYVQLLPTPVNWMLVRACLWGIAAFAPALLTGDTPALTTDTSAAANIITQFTSASLDPMATGTVTANSGTTATPLYLYLCANGSNINTLTAGEIWIFLSLLDVKLAS
jgi:hypothetical protein